MRLSLRSLTALSLFRARAISTMSISFRAGGAGAMVESGGSTLAACVALGPPIRTLTRGALVAGKALSPAVGLSERKPKTKTDIAEIAHGVWGRLLDSGCALIGWPALCA